MTDLLTKKVQSKIEFSRFLIGVYFFALCTSFNLLNYNALNFFYLAISFVTISLLTIYWNRSFIKFWNKPIFLLLIYIIFSFIVNINEAKVTSFIYSVIFIINFLIIAHYAFKHLSSRHLAKLILVILFTYFFVLVLAIIYVKLGLFQFTPPKEMGAVHGPLGVAFSSDGMLMRYYSLSTEPSYAAIIVLLLYYTYIHLPYKQSRSIEILIFSMVMSMMVMFNSGYGFLLLALFFIAEVWRQKPIIAILGGAVFIALLLLTINLPTEIYSVVRLKKIFTDFELSNIAELKHIDSSASFRVLPFYYYVKMINIFDFHFYLGYGAGVSNYFLNEYLFPNQSDVIFQGGFLPGFLIDYGIIGFFLFIYALFVEAKIKLSFQLVLIIFVFTNANFNTQLFWLTFSMLYLSNNIRMKESCNLSFHHKGNE